MPRETMTDVGLKPVVYCGAGIDISNQSLTISSIKRIKHEGIFRCVAFNSEGRGVSNEIRIIVNCEFAVYYLLQRLLKRTVTPLWAK